jgi:hypothetical protein
MQKDVVLGIKTNFTSYSSIFQVIQHDSLIFNNLFSLYFPFPTCNSLCINYFKPLKWYDVSITYCGNWSVFRTFFGSFPSFWRTVRGVLVLRPFQRHVSRTLYRHIFNHFQEIYLFERGVSAAIGLWLVMIWWCVMCDFWVVIYDHDESFPFTEYILIIRLTCLVGCSDFC